MSSKQNNTFQHALILSSSTCPNSYFHVFYSPCNHMHRWGFGCETEKIKLHDPIYRHIDEMDENYEFVYTTPSNIDECEDIISNAMVIDGYDVIDFVDFDLLFKNIPIYENENGEITLNMMYKLQNKR